MTNEGSYLRNLARSWSDNKSIKPGVYNCLITIADRIDAWMVEWPLGADRKPIRVGETVYGEDGKAWCVRGVVIGQWTEHTKSPVVYATDDSGKWRNLLPYLLTHERPDSLGRIADELERYANDSCGEDEIDGATASTLVDFAERIRKLAKKEDRQCQ